MRIYCTRWPAEGPAFLSLRRDLRQSELIAELESATAAGPPWEPRTPPPRCSRVGRVERMIGRGEADFRAAADALRAWKAHAAFGAYIPTTCLEPGVTVVVVAPLGPITVTAPCRIVRTIDDADSDSSAAAGTASSSATVLSHAVMSVVLPKPAGAETRINFASVAPARRACNRGALPGCAAATGCGASSRPAVRLTIVAHVGRV